MAEIAFQGNIFRGGVMFSTTGPLTSVDVDASTRALDAVLANVDVLSTPPGSDTGQAALAVRVISSLVESTGVVVSSGTLTANQGTGGTSAWKVDGSAVTQPVSGTFWQATQPVSGTVTASAATSSTATLSNVSASASSVTALAANSGRVSAVFVNDSTSVAYLKFGSSASSSSYTYRMDPYGTVEIAAPRYTGIVTAIWVSATGAMRVTELT